MNHEFTVPKHPLSSIYTLRKDPIFNLRYWFWTI